MSGQGEPVMDADDAANMAADMAAEMERHNNAMGSIMGSYGVTGADEQAAGAD